MTHTHTSPATPTPATGSEIDPDTVLARVSTPHTTADGQIDSCGNAENAHESSDGPRVRPGGGSATLSWETAKILVATRAPAGTDRPASPEVAALHRSWTLVTSLIRPGDRVHAATADRSGHVQALHDHIGLVLCMIEWDDGTREHRAPWQLSTDAGLDPAALEALRADQRVIATALLPRLHGELIRDVKRMRTGMTRVARALTAGNLPDWNQLCECDPRKVEHQFTALADYRIQLAATGVLTHPQQNDLLTTGHTTTA